MGWGDWRARDGDWGPVPLSFNVSFHFIYLNPGPCLPDYIFSFPFDIKELGVCCFGNEFSFVIDIFLIYLFWSSRCRAAANGNGTE